MMPNMLARINALPCLHLACLRAVKSGSIHDAITDDWPRYGTSAVGLYPLSAKLAFGLQCCHPRGAFNGNHVRLAGSGSEREDWAAVTSETSMRAAHLLFKNLHIWFAESWYEMVTRLTAGCLLMALERCQPGSL